MLRTIEDIYRNGKVELAEVPSDVREEMRGLVTFLDPQSSDLWAREIDEGHAAELRARLVTSPRIGTVQSRNPMVLYEFQAEANWVPFG